MTIITELGSKAYQWVGGSAPTHVQVRDRRTCRSVRWHRRLFEHTSRTVDRWMWTAKNS